MTTRPGVNLPGFGSIPPASGATARHPFFNFAMTRFTSAGRTKSVLWSRNASRVRRAVCFVRRPSRLARNTMPSEPTGRIPSFCAASRASRSSVRKRPMRSCRHRRRHARSPASSKSKETALRRGVVHLTNALQTSQSGCRNAPGRCSLLPDDLRNQERLEKAELVQRIPLVKVNERAGVGNGRTIYIFCAHSMSSSTARSWRSACFTQ